MMNRLGIAMAPLALGAGISAAQSFPGVGHVEIPTVAPRAEDVGSIAHVWSTYESRETESGLVTARGINSIELFWDGKRWWIANGIWADEPKENPISPEYLPSAR